MSVKFICGFILSLLLVFTPLNNSAAEKSISDTNTANLFVYNSYSEIFSKYINDAKKILADEPQININTRISELNEIENLLNNSSDINAPEIAKKIWLYIQKDLLSSKNIEIFKDLIIINQNEIAADILRIGKISFLFKTPDSKICGYLDYSDTGYFWKTAETKNQQNEILKTFKVINKSIPPDICVLPILPANIIYSDTAVLTNETLYQNFLSLNLNNDFKTNITALLIFFYNAIQTQKYSASIVFTDDFIFGNDGKQPAKLAAIGAIAGIYQINDTQKNGLFYIDKNNNSLISYSETPLKKFSGYYSNLFSNLQYSEKKVFFLPLDITNGKAIDALAKKKNIIQHIQSGGLIVYPILLIALISIIIVIERLLFLKNISVESDVFTTEIIDLISNGNWTAAENKCKNSKSIIAKILLTGIKNKTAQGEQLTNALNETILIEMPKLEKFLSTLNIFAAITPLLGLLGTVAGMISTFNAITIFGAGDPRLMSSGISEALITTELGLITAIPILFIHNFFENKIDVITNEIERDCLRFYNAIGKYNNLC